MSTLSGRSHIESDGSLRISRPGVGPNTEIEYTLEFHAKPSNGQSASVVSSRRKTGAERRDSLRRLAGSTDDPTFVRPSQGEFERPESMD